MAIMITVKEPTAVPIETTVGGDVFEMDSQFYLRTFSGDETIEVVNLSTAYVSTVADGSRLVSLGDLTCEFVRRG